MFINRACRTPNPKIPKKVKEMVRTKTVHTSGTFFENVRKSVQQFIKPMFPYRVKYTESEYGIQNNKSLYKLDQQC